MRYYMANIIIQKTMIIATKKKGLLRELFDF